MADPADLVSLIRQSSAPLPLFPPPDLPPELEALVYPGAPPIGGIHTVIFDVYGTLFISAAGDIGSAAEEPYPCPDSPAAELRGYFRGEVLKRHEALRGKTPYPELRVEEIWADFLKKRGGGSTAEESRKLALWYDLGVNPVYPMPGAEETLRILRDRGIRLGLISNAQFFTPLLFEAFFGGTPAALGFDPELLTYSFEMGEAKPSPNLFLPAVRCLLARGLKPENALYVGNDMLNDIFAAAEAGFKTALFAGDRRSLRLREGDRRTRGTMPDRVIRNLKDTALLLTEC
ncbi:hydrolase [Spirochaetia bacterium]|nr:hydrolase [Spirochaetia bacterium]